jgi:hypothetical protein
LDFFLLFTDAGKHCKYFNFKLKKASHEALIKYKQMLKSKILFRAVEKIHG